MSAAVMLMAFVQTVALPATDDMNIYDAVLGASSDGRLQG
jgi:hypothetical protein